MKLLDKNGLFLLCSKPLLSMTHSYFLFNFWQALVQPRAATVCLCSACQETCYVDMNKVCLISNSESRPHQKANSPDKQQPSELTQGLFSLIIKPSWYQSDWWLVCQGKQSIFAMSSAVCLQTRYNTKKAQKILWQRGRKMGSPSSSLQSGP